VKNRIIGSSRLVGDSGTSPSPASSSSASKSCQPSRPLAPQAIRVRNDGMSVSIASIFSAPSALVIATVASAALTR
jgi:hypothetical protein